MKIALNYNKENLSTTGAYIKKVINTTGINYQHFWTQDPNIPKDFYLHLQKGYRPLGYKKGDFPIAEKVAKEVISIPMYPHLTEDKISYVCRGIKESLSS